MTQYSYQVAFPIPRSGLSGEVLLRTLQFIYFYWPIALLFFVAYCISLTKVKEIISILKPNFYFLAPYILFLGLFRFGCFSLKHSGLTQPWHYFIETALFTWAEACLPVIINLIWNRELTKQTPYSLWAYYFFLVHAVATTLSLLNPFVLVE